PSGIVRFELNADTVGDFTYFVKVRNVSATTPANSGQVIYSNLVSLRIDSPETIPNAPFVTIMNPVEPGEGIREVVTVGTQLPVYVNAGKVYGTVEFVRIYANCGEVAVLDTAPYVAMITVSNSSVLNLVDSVEDSDGPIVYSPSVTLDVETPDVPPPSL